MRDYFIRRFLLIPPTLLGITFLVFAITRIVPGGPVERAIMEAKTGAIDGGGSRDVSRGAISEEQLDALKAYYGFDKPTIPAYVHWLGNLVRGDLGTSYRYNEPVASLILGRLPVSLFYGGITMFLVYTICVPLGIMKAIKHRTGFDNATSALIFTGYAVPGYALGAILVVFLAARLEWFPMGGFTSDDFRDLSFWAKARDIAHHAVLPLVCYTISSFAFVTLLMKNHLMDSLAADFVRTAVAKGVSFRAAVLRHALRNSLIPIATNFGQSLSLLVTGSFLIEFIFDINGMGLLGLSSVFDRDYPTVMGVLIVSSTVLLLGNIVADLLVAAVDPRVRFH
ncbi:MAG TPA: ABC transporter permease [Opitutaceae bacterium]|nr:ABC transporter permease [Opitutaceae bacterium]